MLTISHCIYWKFVTETSTTTILTDWYIHITVKTEQRKTRTKVMVITYLTSVQSLKMDMKNYPQRS